PALEGEGGLQTENVLAKRDGRHLNAVKVDGDRQIRNREGPRLGRGQGLCRGQRAARHLDRFGLEARNLQPLLEDERGPAPVDAGPGDAQPYALAVRHGDFLNTRPGRKHALDAADADLAIWGRKLVLDEGEEKRALLLRAFRRRLLGVRGKGGKEQAEDEDADQNACPIPT